jgi:hypothetical protein
LRVVARGAAILRGGTAEAPIAIGLGQQFATAAERKQQDQRGDLATELHDLLPASRDWVREARGTYARAIPLTTSMDVKWRD